MGVPVRSNIFRVGSPDQRYFDSFPIQVAVLFSPSDKSFSPVFRDIFLHLDQITGRDLAFFAVLDPPSDWREIAGDRRWWRDYQLRRGELGFSFDDRTLVYEIARRFGISWNELPVLVIGTTLWAAEFVTTPTSVDQIERQLSALTQLAKDWGRPTIEQIIQVLEEELGLHVRFHPANNELRSSLSQLYRVLETFDPKSQQTDIPALRDHIEREISHIEPETNTLRWVREASRRADNVELGENKLFDDLAAEVTGRLIPPTTVAARAFDNLQRYPELQLAELLDEESRIMIESSLNVGNFLENLLDGEMQDLAPLRFDRSRRSKDHEPVDLTPGAQGIWKALELETNLSMIQAARYSRGIEMPNFFARFHPRFTGDSRVFTGTMRGRKIYRNINARDRFDRTRHEFFTLGNSWHVTKAMLQDPAESLDKIVREVLHGPLLPQLLDDWHTVNQIRNKASHIAPLPRLGYETIINLVLSPGFMEPLMRLKSAMSS